MSIEDAIIWSCNNLAREYFAATKSQEIDESVDKLILELVHKAIKKIDPTTGDFKPIRMKSVPSEIPGIMKLVAIDEE